jgi:hypothetical protein
LPLDLAGIHPALPEVLFLAVRAPDAADALWRSGDGGRTWARVLLLPATEIYAAFSFGASGDTVLVGARQPFSDPGAPPARLYRSRDGGRTFAPGLASGPRGPRFRCLAQRAGVLYACGGGTPNGDDFLLGSSADEGRTWTTLLTAEALAGPEPCRQAACAETSRWLCDTYGYCGHDGGAPDAAARGPGAAGCACGVASGQPGAPALLAFLVLLIRSRRGRCPWTGGTAHEGSALVRVMLRGAPGITSTSTTGPARSTARRCAAEPAILVSAPCRCDTD